MLTLTTPLGTFEAETEDDLAKLLRKSKREASKKYMADQADYKQAQLHACAEGFSILNRIAECKPMPPGWRFHQPDSHYAAVKYTSIDGRYCRLTIETEHGKASTDVGCRFVGSVENGAGHCKAVFWEFENEIQCHAVGVTGDQLALREMFGVKPEMFKGEHE